VYSRGKRRLVEKEKGKKKISKYGQKEGETNGFETVAVGGLSGKFEGWLCSDDNALPTSGLGFVLHQCLILARALR